MVDEVLVVNRTPGRQLRLKTPGCYSMDLAVEILRWVGGLDDCSIADAGWTSAGFGNLIENGITVRLANIQFSVTCSHDDLWMRRLAGNIRNFSTLCEAIRQRFATT